jgi:hypothetical protein
MSEHKHTPGPWRTSRGTVDVYNKDGFTIIECNHYGISDKEEAFANQQLIAAAPEMLEALHKGDVLGNDGPHLLRYAAEMLQDSYGQTILVTELRKKADLEASAIAKATGKEEA